MLKKFSKTNSKGFTLIELLVVIAIIGILATIVLVSLNSARQKARDVKRVGDLRGMQVALEAFFDDNGAYPAGDVTCESIATALSALAPAYLPAVPDDPLAGRDYTYDAPAAPVNDYVLRAQLEDVGHNALDGDIDGTVENCDCSDGVNGFYCIQP